MVRSYSQTRLAPEIVRDLLDLARRGPSAGNTQAISFLVLSDRKDVARYWDTSMPGDKQATFRWQSLLAAPALVLILTRPDSYVDRYSEADKSKTGLGAGQDSWPVPFWWVDAGAVVQNILLLATARGLGACLFGTFDHEGPLKSAFGIPAAQRIVATISLGYPAEDQHARSAKRPRPDLESVIHHGHWDSGI